MDEGKLERTRVSKIAYSVALSIRYIGGKFTSPSNYPGINIPVPNDSINVELRVAEATSGIGDRFISRGANAAAVFPLSNNLSTGHGVNVFVKRLAAAPRSQRVSQ